MERYFKLLVIGDSGTGKTSFVDRYCNNKFRQDLKTSAGVDFSSKDIQWSSDLKVHLNFWDVAGQERFRMLTRPYYKGASGCVILVDLSKRGTLEGAAVWKRDLDEKVILPDGSPVPALLVANKSDLVRSVGRDVFISENELQTFAEQNGFIGCIETSARDGTNVKECVRMILEKMLQLEEDKGTFQQAMDRKQMSLTVPKNDDQKCSQC